MAWPLRVGGSGRRRRVVQRERPVVGAGRARVLGGTRGRRRHDGDREAVGRESGAAELRARRPRSLMRDHDGAAPGGERQCGNRVEAGADPRGCRRGRQRRSGRRADHVDRDRAAAGIGAVHPHRGRAVGRGHVGRERVRSDVRAEGRSADRRGDRHGRARRRDLARAVIRPRGHGRDGERAAVRDLRATDGRQVAQVQTAAESCVSGLEAGDRERHRHAVAGRVGDRQRRARGSVQPAERQRRPEAAPGAAVALRGLRGGAGDARERAAARPAHDHGDRARERVRRHAQRRPCGGVDAHVENRSGGGGGQRGERDREHREQGKSSSHSLNLRHGAVRPCAYDPPDAARSRDRTRGWTARRLGWRVRTRPAAQARALADRGHPRRSDCESRSRAARSTRQRTLLAPLRRSVPAERAGALPSAHLGSGDCRDPRAGRHRGARSRPSAAPGWASGRRLGRPRRRAVQWPRTAPIGCGSICRGGHPLLNPLMLDTEVAFRHERLAAGDLPRLRQPRRSRHGRRAGGRAARGLRLQALQGARLIRTVRLEEPRSLTRDQLATPCRRAMRDGARRPVPPARDRARRCRQRACHRRRRRACTWGRPLAAREVDRGRTPDPGRHLGRCAGTASRSRAAGGNAPVLARRAHAPAAVARVRAATRGGVYDVSNRHAGRTSRALVAVRGARPAHVALVVRGQPRTTLAAYQRRLDELGIRFDALTPRDVGTGAAAGYNVAVVPPGGAAEGPITGVRVVTSLAGITAGLGS